MPNKENFLCGCIYKHPNMSINEFNDNFLLPLLDKISKSNKQCFLMGDFNIDLLKKDSKTSISNFYDNMISHFFSPFILQPTRVTDNSKSLIDNIFFTVKWGDFDFWGDFVLYSYLVINLNINKKDINKICGHICIEHANCNGLQ